MPTIPEREILLATHLAFDFTREAWLEFAKIMGSDPDPFRARAFNVWRTLGAPGPASRADALGLSARMRAKRLCFLDEDFPGVLRELPEGPPVIYYYGELPPPPDSLVAVVGTRRPSAFGTAVTRELTGFLAGQGLGIASGLARGIDAIAHARALAARAYTLAVMGAGLDRIYPSEHVELARDLLEAGGTLLSQFPPGAVPHPSHFPRRNRVIAALSAGTMVVEGSRKSGALITGRAALEQGRVAVAFVQDFRGDFGKGAIELIHEGAYPASGYADALRAISLPHGGKLRPARARDSRSEFSLFEFQNTHGLGLKEAIQAIEKLRASGTVESDAEGRYRWRGQEGNHSMTR